MKLASRLAAIALFALLPSTAASAATRAEPVAPAADSLFTVRAIAHDELVRLPVRTWPEAVALLAGTGERSVRGTFAPALTLRGAITGPDVYVDGLPVRDPFADDAIADLPIGAIERITLRAGPLAAGHAGASGGRVDIETRAATEAWSVEADAQGNGFVPTAARTDWATYDARVAGPLGRGARAPRLALSARRRTLGDRDPRIVQSPWPADAASLGASPFVDGRQPVNGLSGASGWARLDWAPRERLSVAASGFGGADDWRSGSHTYLFDAVHVPREVDRQWGASARVESRSTAGWTLALEGSHVLTDRRAGDGRWFDDFGGLLRDVYANGNPSIDPNVPFFWQPGHRHTRFSRWRAAETRAAISVGGTRAGHTSEMGVERRWPSARWYEGRSGDVAWTGTAFAGQADGTGYDLTGANEAGDPQRVVRTAAWSRDRVELAQGTVEFGLRWDQLDASKVRAIAASLPDSLGDFDGTRPFHDRLSWLSPRVAVRQALDATHALRLAGGRYVSEASLERLDEARWSAGLPPGTGAVKRPESGWSGEVGLESRGGPWRADLTGWYTSVEDLESESFGDGVDGTRQGLEAAAEGERGPWRLRLAYTLSSSVARHVLGGSPRNIAWTGSTPVYSNVPADDDRRHRLAATMSFALPAGSGVPRLFAGLEGAATVRAASGAPYTPAKVFDEVTLAAISAEPDGGWNSARTPWISQLDLAFARPLKLGGVGLRASVWVLNALGTTNSVRVYASSGSATTTTWLATDDGQAYVLANGERGRQLYELAQHRPDMLGAPREVRVGVTLAR